MTPLLHEITRRQLEIIRQGDVRGYVFHGPASTGKALMAHELARQFNCQGDNAQTCLPCRQFAAGSYPDFLRLQPEDRPSITIEQVRQLIRQLGLRPYLARGRRVVAIDQAHLLTMEAQNALLKLIEEPPDQTTIILVTDSLEALLPTVRSRLAAIYFAPLPTALISQFLVQEHGLPGPAASRLAQLSHGAPGTAVVLAADEAAAQARSELAATAQTVLSAGLFQRLLLAKQLSEHKTTLGTWAALLHQSVLDGLDGGQITPKVAAHQLQAIEHFRRSLDANQGPRVALERLMVEL